MEAAAADEPTLLCQEIVRISNGGTSVSYGLLVDDERVEQTFEALMGTLKAARKRGLVEFEGELLLKGQHDDVMVSLTSRGEAASTGDAAKAEADGAKAEEFSNEAAVEVAAAETADQAPRPPMETEVRAVAQAAPASPEAAAGETFSNAAVEEPEAASRAPAEPEFSNVAAEEGFDFKGLDAEPAAASNSPAAGPQAEPEPAPAAEPEPQYSNAAVEEAAPATNEAMASRPPTETVAAVSASEATDGDSKKWDLPPMAYIDKRTQVLSNHSARKTDGEECASVPLEGLSGVSTATAKDEDGKWQVDTGYIDRRTKDVSNLEGRKKEGADTEVPGVSGATSKDEDGKWKVNTGYIDARTKDVNNVSSRKSVLDKRPSIDAVAGAGAGVSATTKKEGDKWKVDVSYIGNRTGDTANLERKFEETQKNAYADPADTKFPYEEIIKGNNRPKEVDPQKKEAYLSADEFKTILGMDSDSFYKMPKWKQQNAKKAKDLF